jgi:hypothetical protein
LCRSVGHLTRHYSHYPYRQASSIPDSSGVHNA